jgi:hypothetical protein
MDMHQKRKMMSENKKSNTNNNNQESLSKVVINWEMGSYEKPLSNHCK